MSRVPDCDGTLSRTQRPCIFLKVHDFFSEPEERVKVKGLSGDAVEGDLITTDSGVESLS